MLLNELKKMREEMYNMHNEHEIILNELKQYVALNKNGDD